MVIPTLEEYQIGWICALPIEVAAAQEMLDENFGPPEEQDNSDTNTYTLGRIGKHLVAIACLERQYGTTSAAIAANNMMRTFSKSLRVGLMVGIGGGIPSATHDIRLGDIVVSCGGVVQHNMGEVGEGGKLTRTGSLNSPARLLLTAVSQMRAAALREDPLYPSYIQQAIHRNAWTRQIFSQPDQHDRFFQTQHKHPSNAATCDDCLAEWEVKRVSRDDSEPQLYYGIVASGNTVVKDGEARERLRKETGALCFEMETADLIQGFPCIIIRGICDYADSHKNKQWQGYAALAAASYAKELLSYVPRAQVSGEKLAADVSSLNGRLTALIQPLKNNEQALTVKDLKIAESAAFDFYEKQNDECLPGTRFELLRELEEWAASPYGKCIFWLNGVAGTGKSTICRTVARRLQEKGLLAASFFFRCQGDRANAKKLFPTLVKQLAISIPHIVPGIQNALENDPTIPDKALWEQFDKLFLRPLLEIKKSQTTSMVVIIDALDECEQEDDIKTILRLLPKVQESNTVKLRFLVTSRPELPVKLAFKGIADNYQDLILHEIPNSVIEHDIYLYFKFKLAELSMTHALSPGWPGSERIRALTEQAVPLFISATTMYRYISDDKSNPEERLQVILADNTVYMSSMDRTYMTVLNQLHSGQDEWKSQRQIQNFKRIAGAIILLANPLSIHALSQLLELSTEDISGQLELLYSVFDVPEDLNTPVRIPHLSFREFLLDPGKKDSSLFWIDEMEVHEDITVQCLNIMRRSLKRNICNLPSYDTQRKNIDKDSIHYFLPPELQYSCRNWLQHLIQSKDSAGLLNNALVFFKKYFLHWVEVMSLLGVVFEVVGVICKLQKEIQDAEDPRVSNFLYDAWRFTLKNIQIVDAAPLQLYYSALVNAPRRSIIRQTFFTEISGEISHLPISEVNWGAELQTLNSHSDLVKSVAFSPDGELLASGSFDNTVKVWDPRTGELYQTLEGHSQSVQSVAFSPDGELLASGSFDNTVKLWNLGTGGLYQTLEGHSKSVQSIAFSPDGQLLASGSFDNTVKIWDPRTGELYQTLEGHSQSIQSVAFLPDGQLLASGSYDKTIRLWDPRTGGLYQTLKGHSDPVLSVAFSPDSRLLASGSYSNTITLWNIGTDAIIKVLKSHSASAHSVAFSLDGRLLASGSDDNTIKLWNYTTGTVKLVLKGHSSPVQSIAFSPNGQVLASGSTDKTLRIWELPVPEMSDAPDDKNLKAVVIHGKTAGDDISDISAEDSVWSGYSTEDSQSSFGQLYVSQEACEKFAEVLCRDPDLRRLYSEALTIFGKERFSRNHDEILKRFFRSLRSEVNDTFHLQTVRLLRYPSSRRQVTEWIYRLCTPSLDPEALRSRKIFLDQKESRDEVLNRFLQSQTFDYLDGGSRQDEHDNEMSSGNSSADDAASTGDDEKGSIHVEQLQTVITFLTSGPSYEILKSNIHLIVHPPTNIPDAIQLGGVKSLRKLLEKQFDKVATGKYTWIKELDEAGYSFYEIADLLYQDEIDAPWIHFEPKKSNSPEMYPVDGAHVQSCVHCHSGDLASTGEPQTRSSCYKKPTGTENLQELCGLAGVIPTSRDPSEWNGAVTFEEQNSVAIVSYAKFQENGELDSRAVLDRIITALNRSCAAAGHMQASGLCCDSFTVIVQQNYEPEPTERIRPVSLCRIDFLSALQILSELKGLSSCPNIIESNLSNTLNLLDELLSPIFQDCQEILQPNDLEGALHSLSVMVQLISLGLLSYTQGHVGSIQPFFLDTPQRKILLAGSKTGESPSKGVMAELTDLTCIGDMVGDQVMTFKVHQLSTDAPRLRDERRFDLLATAEDLLDTWGPGSFIAHRESRASPCAIMICGGIIYSPRDTTSKFHWSPTPHPELLSSAYLNPRSKICIGSLVVVNSDCNINEQECWEKSSCAFENLGVHDDFWTHDESQFGAQAGSYVLLQAHVTKHRISGKTLKQIILEWEMEMLIPALNCLWGLQVSFCTGVTKRVPLRELIADVLPTFAKTFIRERALWLELEKTHRILDAFRTDSFQEWLERLQPKLYDYLMRVVRRIILTLQSTGIDPEGRYLSVAWPYGNPPFRCFRISCLAEANSWTRILADSEDCATFAYISPNCLVTNEVQCRGPSPLWHSTTPLLETAIFRHNVNSRNPPGPLESKKAYFFKKPDALLKVVVERQGHSGTILLFVTPSLVPARMQHRLHRMGMMKNRWTEVRERQRLSDYAEHVAVLTKYDAGT